VSATAQPSRCAVAAAPALRPLGRQSDHALLELSRAGDEQAFEVLVRRHGHELRVYAGRLLGAEGRAEDALQHALMSAWVALRDHDAAVANPRAWLYGIVHNSAITILRRACHDTVQLNDALDAPHPYAGPEVRVIVGEILAGLAEMPEIQRRAIVMTALAGSSHDEAAAALGVSDGAVRGMVYRARAALRQAAGALLPAPLWSWAARFAHGRADLPVDPTDAATAVASASAASAGVGALVVKGGAIVAAVGALAGTGGALLPGVVGPPHHRLPAAHHRAAPPHAGAAGVRQRPGAVTHGESGRSGRHERGEGSTSRGRGSRGSGHGGGSRGSEGASGSPGRGGTSGSHGGSEHSSGDGSSSPSGGSGRSGSARGSARSGSSGGSGRSGSARGSARSGSSGGGHSGSGR
jgi:RNA polymerase sigma-70 factor (ECF subfamily)